MFARCSCPLLRLSCTSSVLVEWNRFAQITSGYLHVDHMVPFVVRIAASYLKVGETVGYKNRLDVVQQLPPTAYFDT